MNTLFPLFNYQLSTINYHLFLDWATMSISLFNTIVLVWLGLTVLLNAEKRDWGMWLASGGLLMGAALFVSHTAILRLGLAVINLSMVFWWTIGLIPAISLPFAWYLVVLWYTGFWDTGLWDTPASPLRERQAPWLSMMILSLIIGLSGLAIGVFLLITPLSQFSELRLFIRWSIAGIPLLGVGYSAYVVLCILLALDALRHPGRLMGSVARQKARPWLTAVSLVLLLVSLLVAGTMIWIVQDSRRRPFFEIYAESASFILTIDLLIALLVGVANVLLGQAIISYEVFTGKTLPRRGLQTHWRRALTLAAGYGIAIGGALAFPLKPVYSLLLTTLLMTFFFALFSWRSYAERERNIENLRPFVTSNRLYDQLLTPSLPLSDQSNTPFHALCADILNAQIAYLAALGPMAPLMGPPLAYGAHPTSLPNLTNLTPQLDSPSTMLLPLDPAQYSGAHWGIPLWSERGLIGIFLLGEKRDGGLYSQEEIEIARISGERLIDTQASVEMSRRLMGLQRERLAQTQLIDQRTRRVLHDEILPTVQASMIALSSSNNTPQVTETLDLLTSAHQQISNLLHQMPTTSAPEVARLGLIGALQRAVEELGHAFDSVTWQITPAAITQTPRIPTLTAEVLFYAAREAIRNAARYGRGGSERPLHLQLTIQWLNGLQIIIQDNGIGLGTGTSHSDGRPSSGHGLSLHSTMMAVIGGALILESLPQQYTRVRLTLPEESLPPVSANTA